MVIGLFLDQRTVVFNSGILVQVKHSLCFKVIRIQVTDVKKGGVICTLLTDCLFIVISVATSPGHKPMFATGSGDNRARIWSYEPLGPN